MTNPKTLHREPAAATGATPGIGQQEIEPHREASGRTLLPESSRSGGSHIVVIALLTLVPDREDQWVDAWRELGQRAVDDPRSGCYGFRLFHNIIDQARYVIASEWESRAAFDSFIQSTGALWISRGLEYSPLPVQFMYLEGITARASGS